MISSAQTKEWSKKGVRGIPEIFPDVFANITYQYVSESEMGAIRTISEEYLNIADVFSERIESPGSGVWEKSAIVENFIASSQNIAILLINQEHYQPARMVVTGLRSIVDSIIKDPAREPDRALLAMGVIGEKFAQEGAKTKQIVHIANEISEIDEAEWTIVHLLVMRDKIEKYDNRYVYNNEEYIEVIDREINRINSALKEYDKEIAKEIDKDEELVTDVIQSSRYFRGQFSISELKEKMEMNVEEEELKDTLDLLDDFGLMAIDGEKLQLL